MDSNHRDVTREVTAPFLRPLGQASIKIISKLTTREFRYSPTNSIRGSKHSVLGILSYPILLVRLAHRSIVSSETLLFSNLDTGRD